MRFSSKNETAVQGSQGDGEIWLDLSRLLWRIRQGRMTGIDRVELSYATHLLRQIPERVRFVAFNYWKRSFGFLPQERAEKLVRAAGPCWRDGTLHMLRGEATALFASSLFLPSKVFAIKGQVRPVYLNVSAHPLYATKAVATMLRNTGAAFVPLIHDVIPRSHPEYVPDMWIRQHKRVMHTIAKHADGVLFNSVATEATVSPYLPPSMPKLGLALGVEPPRKILSKLKKEHPYFLFLGTIEPRKNHIGMLHLWRSMIETHGPACPRLIVVGRRGWDNKHVFKFFDKCESVRGYVSEAGRISDGEVEHLMSGASALLMPSFAEGYGLPVAEALSRGLPVLCSDIPAHREIGRDVPEYFDPIDGLGWRNAILDYAKPESSRRAAQVSRLSRWTCPTWSGHVASGILFIDAVASASQRVPQNVLQSHTLPEHVLSGVMNPTYV